MFLGSMGTYLNSPRTVATHKVHVDDIATGILANFSGNSPNLVVGTYHFYTMNISLSLALNVLLTCMIVVRLVLYSRNAPAAMGSSARISGLYKSIATILVESSALFTVSSVLVIGSWAAQSPFANVFTRILAETQVRAFPRLRFLGGLSHATTWQVIASLLIVQRVADKTAFTSDTTAHENTALFKTRDQGELTSDSGWYPTSSVGGYGTTSGDAGTVIDICRGGV